MRWHHVEGALAAYALEVLEPPEMAAVERHLATCARCRHRADEYQATVGDLLLAGATATPATLPPAHVERLLARVHQEPPRPVPAATTWSPVAPLRAETTQQPVRWSRRSWAAWSAGPRLAVVAALLLLALGGLAGGREVAHQQAQTRQQAQRLATQEAALAVLADPQVVRAPLQPAPGVPTGASGQVFTLPDGRAVVIVVAHLPVPAPGRQYQTVVQLDGAALATGILQVDQRGQGLLVARLPGSSQVERVRITLARAGAPAGTDGTPVWEAVFAP